MQRGRAASDSPVDDGTASKRGKAPAPQASQRRSARAARLSATTALGQPAADGVVADASPWSDDEGGPGGDRPEPTPWQGPTDGRAEPRREQRRQWHEELAAGGFEEAGQLQVLTRPRSLAVGRVAGIAEWVPPLLTSRSDQCTARGYTARSGGDDDWGEGAERRGRPASTGGEGGDADFSMIRLVLRRNDPGPQRADAFHAVPRRGDGRPRPLAHRGSGAEAGLRSSPSPGAVGPALRCTGSALVPDALVPAPAVRAAPPPDARADAAADSGHRAPERPEAAGREQDGAALLGRGSGLHRPEPELGARVLRGAASQPILPSQSAVAAGLATRQALPRQPRRGPRPPHYHSTLPAVHGTAPQLHARAGPPPAVAPAGIDAPSPELASAGRGTAPPSATARGSPLPPLLPGMEPTIPPLARPQGRGSGGSPPSPDRPETRAAMAAFSALDGEGRGAGESRARHAAALQAAGTSRLPPDLFPRRARRRKRQKWRRIRRDGSAAAEPPPLPPPPSFLHAARSGAPGATRIPPLAPGPQGPGAPDAREARAPQPLRQLLLAPPSPAGPASPPVALQGAADMARRLLERCASSEQLMERWHRLNRQRAYVHHGLLLKQEQPPEKPRREAGRAPPQAAAGGGGAVAPTRPALHARFTVLGPSSKPAIAKVAIVGSRLG